MLRVSTISPRDVRELFRVRAALEGLGVAEIIASPERATAAATLRAALSELTDTDGDFATKLEADLGFHLLLCQLSGNAMLMEAWRYSRGPHPRHDHELRDGQHSVDDGAGPARADRRGDRARRCRGREVGGRAPHGGSGEAVRPDRQSGERPCEGDR